jgi:hypothetical protein
MATMTKDEKIEELRTAAQVALDHISKACGDEVINQNRYIGTAIWRLQNAMMKTAKPVKLIYSKKAAY